MLQPLRSMTVKEQSDWGKMNMEEGAHNFVCESSHQRNKNDDLTQMQAKC